MSRKWFLFSLFTLFFVLLFFQFILQSGFISQKAKRYAESSIAQRLGQNIQIEEVQLRLFSTSVALKGISTGTKTAASPSTLLAKEVRIYFSPWSLLTQAFFIRQIVIETPFFSFTPESWGENPFIFNDHSNGKDRPPPPVIIRSIQIKDGTFSYKGEGVVKKASLAHIDANIRSDLTMSRFEVEFSGEDGLLSVEEEERKIDRLEGEFIILPEQIEIKKGFIVSNQTTLRTEGVFHPGGKDFLDLQFDASLPLEELRLPRMSGKEWSGEATIRGHLAGTYPDLAARGRISLPHLFADGLEVGSFHANVSYQNEKVILPSFSGELFSGSFSGSGEGSLSNPKPKYLLKIQYNHLSLERAKKTLFGSHQEIDRSLEGIFLEGDLLVSGEGIEKESLVAEGRVEAKRLPLFSAPFPVDSKRTIRLIALFMEGGFSWKWSGSRLELDKGVFHLPGTTTTFLAGWTPDDGLLVEMALRSDEMGKIADSLDLPLSGRLNLDGTLSVKADHPTFKGRLLLEKWRFRNHPFGTLSSQVSYEDQRITWKEGSLNTPTEGREKGSPPYRFDGSLSLADLKAPAFNLMVKVASADPQEVLTFFKQEIPLHTMATGRLQVSGTPEAFSVKGPLVLEKGSLYGEPFDRGGVELTVTRKAVFLRKAFLEKKDVRVEGEGEIQYKGAFRAALKAPRLRLQQTEYFRSHIPLLSANAAVELFGEGSFQKPQVKMVAAIENLHFGEAETGKGTLKADLDGKSLQLEGNFPERATWIKGEMQLAFPYPFSFQSRFDQLRIDPLLKALSSPLSEMVLVLTGQLAGKGNIPQVNQADFNGSFTQLLADFGDYPVRNEGTVAFHSEQGTFKLESARLKGENTALEFHGSFTPFKMWDLFLKGEADLNLIKFFTKEMTYGKGMATLDLRISDQWKDPRIRGELSLQNGTIRIATWPQSIQISLLSVAFTEQVLIVEILEGEMGRGRFHANGKADLAGLRIPKFAFFLQLTDIRVNLLPELSAAVDGELFFQREEETQTLKGELTLQKAVYEKRVELKSVVMELDEKRERGLSRETPLIGSTQLNVHLNGRENIWINNNIAKIPLEVDLLLKGTFDRPLLIGRIGVPRGSIYFRKNEFQVTSGSLEFLNPEKIDPLFDIKAKTRVRNNGVDYTIDLGLDGTLSQFNLTLTSSPSLPETDILALLTVGKTTAEIAQGQGGAGGEATSFVVSELLEGPVQKLTGVDRIQVEPYRSGTKSSSGPRLTAEKRLLEDRLLVIYSTTLDPSEEDLIRMVLDLSKNISLAGGRNENGRIGGEIRFRFEFR